MPRHRMGDLVPTDLGDRLLPGATHGRGDPLDFELRGPDGGLIPTADIGVNDCEYLLAMARKAEDDPEPILGDEEAAELQAAIEHDAALIAEWFDASDSVDLGDVHVGDEPWQESPFPRYQILVTLFDDADIP